MTEKKGNGLHAKPIFLTGDATEQFWQELAYPTEATEHQKDVLNEINASIKQREIQDAFNGAVQCLKHHAFSKEQREFLQALLKEQE